MKTFPALTVLSLLLVSPAAFAQDVMKYGLKHLTVLAEDQKVRVLHYTAHKGDQTPVHSHPTTVVYVIKGGRIEYTMPDGVKKVVALKTGESLIRAPVTHSEVALDDLESILVEIKQ